MGGRVFLVDCWEFGCWIEYCIKVFMFGGYVCILVIFVELEKCLVFIQLIKNLVGNGWGNKEKY